MDLRNISHAGISEYFHSLNIDSYPDLWEKCFKDAAASFPGEDLRFVATGFINEVSSSLKLNEDMRKALLRTAQIVAGDIKLVFFLWLSHYVLFVQDSYEIHEEDPWPLPGFTIEEDRLIFHDMFPALVIYSNYDRVKKLYEDKSIPWNVFEDTMGNTVRCMNEHFKNTGRYGIRVHNLCWLNAHMSGKLYRLGRLQYEISEFSYPYMAFRNKLSSVITVLAANGLKVTRDGQLPNDGENSTEDGTWTAQYIETEDHFEGCSVSGDGCILKERVRLSKSEWDKVLAGGDSVLNTHIPDDGRLAPELVMQSLASAISFFHMFYPEKAFVGFTCYSWLMEQKFRKLLPAHANILQFQELFRIFPYYGDDEGLFQGLFDTDKCPLEKLRIRTSFQRKVCEYLKDGGTLRSPAGFFTLNDMENRLKGMGLL